MADSWPRVRLGRTSNIVRAILHLAGASRIADAAKELSEGRPSGDFSEVPAELAAQVLNQASHEFRQAADGDLSSAEAALEEVLRAAPEHEVLGRALRNAEMLRMYLLSQGGRERRADLLSDDAQRYFDRLLELTCGFVSRTVHRTDLAGKAERAGIGELLTTVDLLRQDMVDLLELTQPQQQPVGKASPGNALAAVRLAGESARQSAAPEILPAMDRLAALERAVGAVGALSRPLAITGEGGLGKSVLAGQLFGLFEDTGAVAVFVPCTRIPASAELTSAAAVDLAFGQAAAADREAAPLTAILSAVPADARPVVIVDTLDLILTEDNSDDISYVLRQVAQAAVLVMTCRDQEWHSYLQSERGLVGALYRIPNLTPREIREWVAAYVGAIPEHSRETFATSFDKRVPGADVFSSPLRLAMACDLYAAAGAVPAGLTVTRLYEAYWESRVARDRRGRRADRATQRVRVAEALAASIWEASGNRFVEFVPANESMTAGGLEHLLSEGTVQVVGGRYAFFHQTYAEYGVARHLAVRGTEADLDRLEGGLRTETPGYWAVAKHLLMLEVDPGRLQELAARVPLDSVEGIRIHFQSAMAKDSEARIERLAADLKVRRPELLIASVGVLASAVGNCVGPALDIALWCLDRADRSSFPKVAATVGPLISAAEPTEQTAALERALDLCLERVTTDGRRAADARRHVGPVIQRLLEQAVADGVTGVDLRMLVNRYGELLEAGRAGVLAMVRRVEADQQLKAELITRALNHRCPAGALDDAVEVLADVWQEPGVRAAGGWSDWRSMLGAALPDLWASCQVRLMLQLCADPAISQELLTTAFDPNASIERTQYTNAVIGLATVAPYLVAEAVIQVPATTSNGVLGTLASVTSHLANRVDTSTRLKLADALDNYLPDHPHRIWPVVIRLAGQSPTRLREYIDRLTRFSAEDADGLMHGRATVRRGFDSILSSASPVVVREFEVELRALCSSADSADTERLAGLQGRLTPVSAAARDWVSEQLLDGTGQKAAKAAAKAVVDSLDDWDSNELSEVGQGWFLGLLGSAHPYAVREFAVAAEKLSRTVQLSETWAPVVVERLRRSIADGEDGHLQTALIRLLAAIGRTTGVGRAEVMTILEAHLEAVRSLLDPSPRANVHAVSHSYSRLLDAITTLGLEHLELDGLSDLVVSVLTTIDSAAIAVPWGGKPDADIAGKPRVHLGHMLTGVALNQPLVLPRLEEAWEHCSASNKAAIAECVSVVEAGTRGIVSLRLARRDDCPPEVSNLLHTRFGG